MERTGPHEAVSSEVADRIVFEAVEAVFAGASDRLQGPGECEMQGAFAADWMVATRARGAVDARSV